MDAQWQGGIGPVGAGPAISEAPAERRARPKVGLVLQGGGALGAYQAGVYQALHEAGHDPDWIAGVSIGGINAAIIAGNPRERRLERLREFWETITARPLGLMPPEGDVMRRVYNGVSSMMTTLLGQPSFFSPLFPGPWFAPRGSRQATSLYDNAPLRQTLNRLIDFDLINAGQIRVAVGATNITTGNFSYFDNAHLRLGAEHVLASGALPPALPMVRVGTDWFWDGGLVSNTPLQHLLDNAGSDDMLVFQVDLFSARGDLPRDLLEVMARQKDIMYSSRTRSVTQYYARLLRGQGQLKKLLDRLPEEMLDAEERALKRQLSSVPRYSILHLIYQEAAYESQVKDYEFSAASMREHWEAGCRDTRQTLMHEDWLTVPPAEEGIAVHDVHRAKG